MLLGVAFLVAFIVLLGIGDGAPDVLIVATSEDAEDSLTYRKNDQVNFFNPDFDLSRENQLFWMDLRLGTGDGLLDGATPLTTDVDMIITVGAGGCAGRAWDAAVRSLHDWSSSLSVPSPCRRCCLICMDLFRPDMITAVGVLGVGLLCARSTIGYHRCRWCLIRMGLIRPCPENKEVGSGFAVGHQAAGAHGWRPIRNKRKTSQTGHRSLGGSASQRPLSTGLLFEVGRDVIEGCRCHPTGSTKKKKKENRKGRHNVLSSGCLLHIFCIAGLAEGRRNLPRKTGGGKNHSSGGLFGVCPLLLWCTFFLRKATAGFADMHLLRKSITLSVGDTRYHTLPGPIFRAQLLHIERHV